MPSNLIVPVSGGCSLLQVHSFEDRIFAKFLFNVNHRMLHPLLSGKFLLLLLFANLLLLCILKQTELLKLCFPLRICLRDHTVCRNIDPPDHELFIDNIII